MPKRSRTAKPHKATLKALIKKPRRVVTKAHRQEKDENETAFSILQKIIKSGEAEGKNPLAMALGRMGGLKGGRARADKLSDTERSASAKKAAQARWGSGRNSTR
jgi:hypothetical protein